MVHRVKWLIVFLVQNVHEVEEDTTYMNKTLDELLGMPADPSIGIAGCISTTSLKGTLEQELDKPVQGKGKVHSFVVQLLQGIGEGQKRLRVLEELPSRDGLQHVNTVIEVFRCIRRQFEYEQVLLTTWDHGSGYSIFAPPDVPQPNDSQPQRLTAPLTSAIGGKEVIFRHPIHHSPVPRLFQQEALRQGIKKLRRDSTLAKYRHLLTNPDWLGEPYGLTMDMLHNAILACFGKVDVIFMRNCFMQMFDTGFVLHDVADYLVACESIMWFPAYDYTVWLKALEAVGPAARTTQEVAATAILGFTQANISEEYRIDTALFGNDLSYYPALNYTMDRMIRELIFYVKGHKGKLLHCRRSITDIVKRDYYRAPYQYVDARWWFLKAGELLADNETYQEALKDFLALHQRTVGDRRFVGTLVGGDGYQESGFSLYFPAYARNIAVFGSFYGMFYALHNSSRSQFTRSSLWDEFIGYLFLDLRPRLLRRKG